MGNLPLEELLNLILMQPGLRAENAKIYAKLVELISVYGNGNLIKGCIRIFKAAVNKGASIIHENGFSKISLYKHVQSEIQLRLHIWPAGAEDASIHSHRWNFYSYVVDGSIEIENYYIGDNNQYEYKGTLCSLSDANSDLKKMRSRIADVSYLVNNKVTLPAGSAHYLEHTVLHKVNSPHGGITLMLSGRPLRDFSTMIQINELKKARSQISDKECIVLMKRLIGNVQ